MAWTAPRTWTVGELVAASDLNEQLRDNLIHLKLAVGADGKLPALSSAYVADLSGVNLTDVVLVAASNTFSAGTQDFGAGAGARFVLPVGADKWAT